MNSFVSSYNVHTIVQVLDIHQKDLGNCKPMHDGGYQKFQNCCLRKIELIDIVDMVNMEG